METIIDFTTETQIQDWMVINDGVMGGISSSSFKMDKGCALFSGTIALDYNGGFASVRTRHLNCSTVNRNFIILKLKGDGKRYQLRIKADRTEAYSYTAYFKTSGDWQVLTIPLKDLEPKYRGRLLKQSKYKGSKIEALGFLCANKKAENFKLYLQSIHLE